MAIMYSAKGTTYPSFRIHKSGPTIYQGIDSSRQTVASSPVSGDIYLSTDTGTLSQYNGSTWSVISTTTYVDAAIANLVDSAPELLNTLDEIAAALGDDANFAVNVQNALDTKLENVVEDLTPQLGGDLDVNGKKIVGTTVTLSGSTGVVLEHGNVSKLNTSSTGISITGNVEFDSFSATGGDTYTIPTAAGTDGQVLILNGTSGSNRVLEWTTLPLPTLDGQLSATNEFSLELSDGISTDTVKFVAGANMSLSWDGTNKIVTLNASDEGQTLAWDSVSSELTISNGNTVDLSSLLDDTYVSAAAFDSATGVLTLTRSDSNTVTVNLDGRYLQTETDSQTLSWDSATREITITNGNTIDLSSLLDDVSHVVSAETPPSNPIEGDLWWDSANATLNIYYDTFWIDVAPAVNLAGYATETYVDTRDQAIYEAAQAYTDAVVTTGVNNLDSDGIPEGSVNLYYTDARVQAISINEVVEDTTPQLGGNLDLNSNDIDGTGNIDIVGDVSANMFYVTDVGRLNGAQTTHSTADTFNFAVFNIADYRSMKIVIQASNTTDGTHYVSELLCFHDGTTAYSTEYATMYTSNDPEIEVVPIIDNGQFIIRITQSVTATIEYKFLSQMIGN